jgi:uncharacterized protein YbjT (DUF2867 family)
MILVAGGTGVLGSAIVRRLLEQGRSVRVMTRALERGRALAERGATLVTGDLRDPASLRAAVHGATHVITTANAFVGKGGDTLAAVDEQGTSDLVDAAREAGVRQFIFTSALLPEAAANIDFFASKFRAEDYVRSSGVGYTILRPTALMETWAQIIGEPLIKTGKTQIFGSGMNPINFVAVEDVAAVAVMTIDRPDAMNASVDIIGPENLTLLQVADIFDRLTGTRGRRTHLPVRVMLMLAAMIRPFNPIIARQVKGGAMMATAPLACDPAPMLARYPMTQTTMEAWARAKYAGVV